MADDLTQLATAFKRGTVAFDRIYAGLKVQLSPIASKYKLVGHDKEDLIQISIISVYRSLGTFTDDTCFEAFATTVAKRRIIDIIKAIRKRGEPLAPQYDLEADFNPRERAVIEHPIWKLIIDEEVALHAEREGARASRLQSEKQRSNADYRDYRLFVREWRPEPRRKRPKRKSLLAYKFNRRIRRLSDGRTYDTIRDAARENRHASKISLLNAATHGYVCAKSKWSFA